MHDLPPGLAELGRRLQESLGTGEAEAAIAGWSAPRTPAFRVNLMRTDADTLARELAAAGIAATRHPLSPWSFTCAPEAAYALKGSRAFHDGRLYVQSLPSQVPALLGEVSPDDACLDCTAAPGGKTSLLAMRRGRGRLEQPGNPPGKPSKIAHFDAIERSPIRHQLLKHNLTKLGCDWVRTWKSDSRSLPQAVRQRRYRHILVDPPCTGSGTVVPADARTWAHLAGRYDGYVAIKAQQQYGIAMSAAELLAPGGSLIYSTCSLDPEENEAVVDALLTARPELSLIDATAPGPLIGGAVPALAHWRGRDFHPELARTCLRLQPGAWGEGFFVAWLVSAGSSLPGTSR